MICKSYYLAQICLSNTFLVYFLLLVTITAILITRTGFKHFHPFAGELSSFIQHKKSYFSIYLPAVYGHVLSGGLLMFIGFLGFSDYMRTHLEVSISLLVSFM